MSTPAPLVIVPPTPVPDTINVLLYGPPKAGKSTAAATAPGPILWLNLEGGGALSYARKIAAERGHDIHEVRVEHTDILEPILRSLVWHVRSGQQPQVRTVVVDTLGKVRDHLARNIGGDHPQIQHWGDVAKIIEGFVKALRDAQVNVVFLAHEEIKEGENGEGRIVEPLIGGKSTVKVCGEVDVIAYCGRVEADGTVRYMGQLVEDKGRRAGDRSGGLGAYRELDLSEWLDAFRRALAPSRKRDPAPELPVVADELSADQGPVPA